MAARKAASKARKKAAKAAPRRKPGRPRKDEAAAKGVELVAGGMVLEDVAAKLTAEGKAVSARTIRRAVAALAKAPELGPGGGPGLPDPAGPRTDGAGAGELAPEPAELDPTDLDPLATLARVQKGLERDLRRLDVKQVVQRRAIAGLLIQVAKAAEIIRLGRPEEVDEEEKWRADRDAVLRHIRRKLPELLAARGLVEAGPP